MLLTKYFREEITKYMRSKMLLTKYFREESATKINLWILLTNILLAQGP